MKEIPLTQGQVAIVDDWRFEELNQYNWQAAWDKKKKSYYAKRKPGKTMHSVIAGTPKGFHTDHINGDTLYNLESNLRVCTCSQNQMNRGKQRNNTSGYKGVSMNGRNWQARIRLNKKLIYLGTYPTPEKAARAYDEVAKRLCGEFATLNFPE